MPTIQTRPTGSTSILPQQPSSTIRFTEPQPSAASLRTHDHFEKETSHIPWDLSPTAKRDTLMERARKLKPEELELPFMQLASADDQDTRSPHRIVRSAIAAALKDKYIDVGEAAELRGVLLTQLPKAERRKYDALLQQAPMAKQAQVMLRQLDPDYSGHAKSFSAAEIQLLDSPVFKVVFPNFMALSLAHQRQVLNELEVFLQHFPDLLPRLASLSNDHYGPGFQYFFVEPGENEAFDKVMPKGTSGVVMPGASVVKDPLLRLLANKLSLQQLDRGGMYTNAISYGVFSHEFAHVVHLNLLNDDQRDQIKNLYDNAWNKMRQSQGQQGFVSEYAKTNPYEYFAEGVEFYLTGDAKRLQARDPRLYAFVAKVFAPGVTHNGKDGNLFTDPERVHALVSQQGSRTLYGAAISRESDLFSVRHFEGGSTQELAVMGGPDALVARASLGLKAAWKPFKQPAQPASVYATFGASVQGGVVGGQASVGAGGFVGAGIDYKHLNLEVRQNFMAGHNVSSGTEVRAGLRFEF